MLTDVEKKLLAWALDCALTERDKVGLLKKLDVMKAAQKALRDPDIKEQVLGMVELLSPDTAKNIREFLKNKNDQSR
jgi:hypothetical protein